MFLVSLRSELIERRNEMIDTPFVNMVYNLFSPLEIKWESGWINYKKDCPVERISKSLENLTVKSDVFNECEFSCYDIIQSNIKLPLKHQDVSDLKRGFHLFIKEFIKMEKDLGNNFYKMYLLKCIVDSSKKHANDYESGHKSSIINFKNDIFHGMNKVKKFYDPKCNFESLLCGIIVFSKCFEGCLYIESEKQKKWTDKQNDKLEVKKPEHLMGIIDYNLVLPYKFNLNTNVKIFDSVSETTKSFKIDRKYINTINTNNPLSWGLLLSKIHDNENIDNLIERVSRQKTPCIDDINLDNLSPTTNYTSESDTEYEYDSDFELY